MEQVTAATKARYVYILDPSHYFLWSQQERDQVERWIRDHDVDPKDVLVGKDGHQLTVRVDETGYYEFSAWVTRRGEDDKTVQCPNCPSCLQQERVTRPAVSPWPTVILGMWSES